MHNVNYKEEFNMNTPILPYEVKPWGEIVKKVYSNREYKTFVEGLQKAGYELLEETPSTARFKKISIVKVY